MSDDRRYRRHHPRVTRREKEREGGAELFHHRDDPEFKRDVVDRWRHLYLAGETAAEVERILQFDEAERTFGREESVLSLPQPDREKPSPAELRVIECLSHGLGTDGTADVLSVSAWTVRSHLKMVNRKLAAKSREHAVAICLREGWIH